MYIKTSGALRGIYVYIVSTQLGGRKFMDFPAPTDKLKLTWMVSERSHGTGAGV